jgi:hypothetical protein
MEDGLYSLQQGARDTEAQERSPVTSATGAPTKIREVKRLKRVKRLKQLNFERGYYTERSLHTYLHHPLPSPALTRYRSPPAAPCQP